MARQIFGGLPVVGFVVDKVINFFYVRIVQNAELV